MILCIRKSAVPIETSVPIVVFDQESFHQVDRRVTGIAFDIHNEFGRYLDEVLYKRELTSRSRAAGFTADSEVCITVSLDDFSKDYYIDHLVSQGVIIESKTVSALAPAHRGQTLNYLFFCGLHHATLLNFRTHRVQHEFVSTQLTFANRRHFKLTTNAWTPLTPSCHKLYEVMLCLLDDWGAYLDPILYRDALAHFICSEENIHREVDVHSCAEVIGTQKAHLITNDIAFSVTTSTHQPESVYSHQRRFLQHTKLRAIQWINLNHDKIEFRTIT
jgi:GxxExxY protein